MVKVPYTLLTILSFGLLGASLTFELQGLQPGGFRSVGRPCMLPVPHGGRPDQQQRATFQVSPTTGELFCKPVQAGDACQQRRSPGLSAIMMAPTAPSVYKVSSVTGRLACLPAKAGDTCRPPGKGGTTTSKMEHIYQNYNGKLLCLPLYITD